MPVVNRIDRNNISTIRIQIQDALNRVSLETGLSIKLGGIRYTDFSFTFKGEAIVAGPAAGNPEAVAKINWDRECRYFGLAPEDFGKTIRLYNGKEFKLCGLTTKRSKYQIRGSRAGKVYKLSASHVVHALRPMVLPPLRLPIQNPTPNDQRTVIN